MEMFLLSVFCTQRMQELVCKSNIDLVLRNWCSGLGFWRLVLLDQNWISNAALGVLDCNKF
jgi:hypothetical protein